MTRDTEFCVRLEGQVGQLRIDVNLETSGGPLVLVGPNGAGKTSLLLMALGILPIERGLVRVGSQVLVDTSVGIALPVERRRLGYVPQEYALFPHLTVRQNIEFAAKSSAEVPGQRGAAERVAQMLAEFKLAHLAARRTPQLSGGEKQRVALARTLAVAPHALLLDEPLAALDASARHEVRIFLADYLKRLRMPSLIVTHDPADVRALGHGIAVLEGGRIVQTGTWAELKAAPASAFVEGFVSGPG